MRERGKQIKLLLHNQLLEPSTGCACSRGCCQTQTPQAPPGQHLAAPPSLKRGLCRRKACGILPRYLWRSWKHGQSVFSAINSSGFTADISHKFIRKKSHPQKPNRKSNAYTSTETTTFLTGFICLSLGQLYVFPAAGKKNITEIWWLLLLWRLLLHESVKINCTVATLQNTWMKSRGEKFVFPKHGQSATKVGRITGEWKQWRLFLWFACLWSNSQTPGVGKMIANIFQIFTFSQFHINEAGKPCLPNRIEKLLLKSEELNGDF